jgi:molybdopterin synthase sulfur carrier subunit
VIKVLFFARLREELQCGSLDVDWREDVASLEALEKFLLEQGGVRWEQVLSQDNIIRSINQTVVEGAAPIRDGDEVAFFPPVTGG